MTKLEDYTAKAEASLAAAEAATNDRDRAFHRNAHSIWRKLMRGAGETRMAVTTRDASPPKPVAKAAPAKRAMKSVKSPGRPV